jgi:tRNA U34 2-thiouridine synthase MnmA/TrmU
MKDLKQFIKTTIREFLNENKKNIKTKVVDENGKPLVMYHGGSYTGGEFKGAGWFTTSKKDAKYYAKQNDGIVTKAYLIVNNPLYTGHIKHLNIVPTKEMLESAKKRKLNIKIEDGVISFIEANGGILIARDIGRDGVIDLVDGQILDVVIFDNDQIVLI